MIVSIHRKTRDELAVGQIANLVDCTEAYAHKIIKSQ